VRREDGCRSGAEKQILREATFERKRPSGGAAREATIIKSDNGWLSDAEPFRVIIQFYDDRAPAMAYRRINLRAVRVLRFALGVAGSCLWVCGEAWINQVSEDSVRGRVVALFSMATAGGFALGPLLLTLTGTDGATPFLIAGAMILVSAIPLLSVVPTSPILDGERKGGLAHYLWLAPVPMLLCGLIALADSALLTFLPLYAMRLDLSEARALYLLTLMGVGGVLGQVPIGWLADRVDRMLLAAVCTLLIMLASLAMPLVLAHHPWNLLFMVVFGAILNGIYTVAMVLIGHRFRGADLAAASALFGVMWGSGSILGPSVGGLAMDFSGSHGLPLALTAMFALCLPMQVGAWLRRRGGDRSD